MPDPGSTDHPVDDGTGPADAAPVDAAPAGTGRDIAPATSTDLAPADLAPTDATPVASPAPSPVAPPAPDYDEHGTPSLAYVRDKIESRYATSLAAGELAEDDDRVREQAEQMAERDRKAADRLAEIRRSLG